MVWVVNAKPGSFTTGKDAVPIVQDVSWDTGEVWTDAENLSPTRIRYPDRPARSESLYRLSYRGPYVQVKKCVYNIRGGLGNRRC